MFIEAGFYPTTVSYLSIFYTRYEFARRLGLFYGQYAVAGALGGVLSYAVFSAYPPDHNHQPQPLTRDDGKEPLISAGQKPWQVLFILEGGLTIFVALLGFLWLPRSAGSAWFLRQDERRWAEQRVMRDRHAAEVSSSTKGESSSQDHVDDTGGANEEITSENERDEEQLRRLLHDVGDPHSASDQRHQAEAPSNSDITSDKGLSRRDVLEAFSDWKIWYLLVVNICSSIPAMAFSVFLPLVVKGLGVDPVRANLLTAPPFVTGAITLWIFAWWSDKKQERMIPILWGLAINLVGLTATVMLAEDAYAARYAALCVLLGGSFIASPLTVSWLTGNIEEPGKRAIVLGINGWGNLAGLFSAMLFSPRHAPHYVIPFYITFALVLFSFVGYIAFRALLIRENRVRAQSVARWAPEEVEHEKRWGTGPFHRRRGMTRIADLIDRWIGRSIWSDNHSDGRRGDDKITFVYGL